MYTRVGKKIVFSAISTLLIFLVSLFCFPDMHKAFKLAILIAGLEMWAFAAYYHKTPPLKYVNPTRTPALDFALFVLCGVSIIGFIILGIMNVDFQIVFETMLIEYILAYIILIDRKHAEKQPFIYMFLPLILFIVLAVKQFTS